MLKEWKKFMKNGKPKDILFNAYCGVLWVVGCIIFPYIYFISRFINRKQDAIEKRHEAISMGVGGQYDNDNF